MIYANLKNGGTIGCPEAVRRALAWLSEHDICAMEPGRHPIEGEDMFVMVQDVTTRPPEGSMLEAHYKYVDLMYWPQAGERIGVARLYGGETAAEDHPEDDYRLLASAENENVLRTVPGDFLALFPADAHRPCLHPDGEPVRLRKAVVKIAVSLLDE